MDENPFAGLSKMSLQEALLRRLAEISNLRRAARENKTALYEAKQELHQIYCALHELAVIPFRRIQDYLQEEVPEKSKVQKRA
jgi:hypothetical protein